MGLQKNPPKNDRTIQVPKTIGIIYIILASASYYTFIFALPPSIHHTFTTTTTTVPVAPTGADHRSLRRRAAGFPSPRAAEGRQPQPQGRKAFGASGAEGGGLEVPWHHLGMVQKPW